jgi:hypothetical protein
LYKDLLAAFVKREQSQNFQQSGSLGTALRPMQVSDWIRDGWGRSGKVRPIKDLQKYETEWGAWWAALQLPWRGPWREQRAGAVPAPKDAEWGKLGFTGQNGVLSVVAALYWWACAERVRGIQVSSGWRDAVEDTTWVLRCQTES